MDNLQQLTDRLGERLARSVAVDDPRLRLQSYSPHYGIVDEQRMTSILQRQASADATEWAFAHGIQTATDWVRLPASEERGMLSRVCIPIRLGDMHLGYLWLIDADESLTDEQLALAAQAASDAATIMYRESLVSDLRRSRERELMRDLLDEDVAVRGQAVDRLLEESLLEIARPAVALVLDIAGTPDASDGIAAAELALTTARRFIPSRQSIHLVRPDHGILVVAVDRQTDPTAIAVRIKTAYERTLGASGAATTTRVGKGTEVSDGRDVHISYRQARTAAHVGRILGVDEVVEWEQLGVYRLLADLGPEQVRDESLHPALAKLAGHHDGGQLLETLEVFLDNAGDARMTAEQLFLHRSTLYHRLARIEEIGQVDLKRGSERLDLHLGLKVARLTGRVIRHKPAGAHRPRG